MKSNYKKRLFLAMLGVSGLSSCEKQLDINTDPTRPSYVGPDLVLPAGTGNLAYVMGAPFNIIGNFFAQHWTESLTANQYKDYDRYRIGQTTNDRDYQTLFTGALKNFRFVIDRAKGDSSNYAAIAGLQSAYTYQVLSDGFDKVPFTESLLGAANTQPRFDEGPVVYDGIIQLINQALGRINTNSQAINVGGQDLVFAGDMNKWRRFGNTLKLKVFLRQIYARPAAGDSIRALYARGAQFLGATENAQVTGFSSATQNGNPLYLAEVNPASGILNNIIASQTSTDYLTSTNDPRIDDFFSRPGSTPTVANTTAPHVGTPQGDAIRGGSGTINTRSRPNLQKIAAVSSPVVLLSGAESLFLQAEAVLRGFASSASAQLLYEQGIQASFTRFGRTMPAGFLTSTGIAFDAGTGFSERRLEQIITQKWVALNGTEGFEAWTELRRTKYPSFITGTPYSDLPNRTYAKRLIYPFTEISRNANAPAVETAEVPVWWDKK